MTKNWVGPSPPPLIWTKSKRTAAFSRDPFPNFMCMTMDGRGEWKEILTWASIRLWQNPQLRMISYFEAQIPFSTESNLTRVDLKSFEGGTS